MVCKHTLVHPNFPWPLRPLLSTINILDIQSEAVKIRTFTRHQLKLAMIIRKAAIFESWHWCHTKDSINNLFTSQSHFLFFPNQISYNYVFSYNFLFHNYWIHNFYIHIWKIYHTHHVPDPSDLSKSSPKVTNSKISSRPSEWGIVPKTQLAFPFCIAMDIFWNR